MAATSVDELASPTRTVAPSSRLYSLDVFRGATIAAMIVVNNPGNDFAYPPLNHAQWNGWTPTDLIFPFFLFIVGVSLTLSFRTRIERGESKRNLLLHTVRRSTIIFLIGLFLNGFPLFHLATWRVAGVLQRIAVAYLAAAIIALYSGWRGIALWIGALLLGYWVAMRFIPVPGLGVPSIDMPINDPNANLSWYIDKLYLPGAMYEKTRDPEGILSTFPAIATALLGVLTGEWMNSSSQVSAQKKGANPSTSSGRALGHPMTKVYGMLAFGIAGIIAGQIWHLWFPINKKLWTSSFVLFAAGCALIALAACYWVCDIKRHRGAWTKPFVVFGTNAIAAYVLADLVSSVLFDVHLQHGRRTITLQDGLYRALFGGIASRPLGSLLYSIVFVAVCWLPIYAMYRKRIFLKV
jgi:predicted acyltransferase